jgi:hypothetical protein
MSRPHGSKNRRTLIREAEEAMGGASPTQIDCLHVLELAMQHFYGRALLAKQLKAAPEVIAVDLLHAVSIAEKIAPYRHPRLSAVKLAGDPNNPARFKDDATAEELRQEIIKRLTALSEAGVLDLTAVPVPEDGIANRLVPSVDQSGMSRK